MPEGAEALQTNLVICSREFQTKARQYHDRLVSLKLDSSQTYQTNLIMCYKIINGLVGTDCSDFFSFIDFHRTHMGII